MFERFPQPNGTLEAVRCVRLVLLLFCAAISAIHAQWDRHSVVNGPVYVPLDSWVYPAFKRLAGMGFAPDAESLAMPWTRAQCRMLVEEAGDLASQHSVKVEAARSIKEAVELISALSDEFPSSGQHSTAAIESLYSRYSNIAGTPLRDSYHFGQTLVNDFGRPFGGENSTVIGVSAYATYGRLSAYFRGELQQANGSPTYSTSFTQFVAALDGVPPQAPTAFKPADKFDPLEAYLGAQVGIFDFTVGKQSLWWGPGEESAFSFSSNAEPMLMARLSQATPIVLPGPLRLLGRIRTQFLVGQLAGHHFPPRPLINAQKITFQLTQNLEIGFTRSSIFGGVGHPLTTASILASFFSVSSTGSTAYGSRNDPGDRRSGFDFRWQVPFVRRYLSIYSDSFADDEPNPLDSPRRSAWGPGLYVTQLPKLRHLDLRFETYSTWLYKGDEGGLFFYWNNQYRDAYTNQGNLLGSWIGRDARAYVASSNYWISARNKIALSYRQTKTGSNFLPGGGTQTDVSATLDHELGRDLRATLFVQYERRSIPVLGGPQSDFATQLQLTFLPHSWRFDR